MTRILKKHHLVFLLIFVTLFSSETFAAFDSEGLTYQSKSFFNRYSTYLSFVIVSALGGVFDLVIVRKRRVLRKGQAVTVCILIFLLVLILGTTLFLMERHWKFDVSFPGLLRVIELSWKDLLIVCGSYILAHVPLGFWLHKCLEPKKVDREGPNE